MTSCGSPKSKSLEQLAEAVQHCTLCPRLCSRSKVLSASNGNVASKLMFVAEAPGRLGADRTQIPLCGDKTGDNFEALLGAAGMDRSDVFVTNALLCNPRDESGNNSTPVPEEVANCSPYLEMTITLVQPEVVVALGATALSALAKIAPHSVVLGRDIGKPFAWAGRVLVPLYHPGPRALVHRPMVCQMADFARLADLVQPDHGLSAPYRCLLSGESLGSAQSSLREALHAVVQYVGPLSQFKLTKLLYLVDLRALERLGHTITGEVYLRQQEGPWLPNLWQTVEALDGREVIARHGKCPLVSPGPSPRFHLSLGVAELDVILDVLQKYGDYDNAMIKSAAYRTAPMRYVLRQERAGRPMTGRAIIYKDKLVDELGLS